VSGASLGFDAKAENWQQYQLDDGSVLKIKLVLLDVIKLDGEFNDNGDPVYQFAAQQIVTVVVPDELKRKVN
jgi:hypothetical protein